MVGLMLVGGVSCLDLFCPGLRAASHNRSLSLLAIPVEMRLFARRQIEFVLRPV